jgi:hypothetical protein
MEKNTFEKDLEIDPAQLDVEAAMQGETFFKYAEALAEARAEVDQIKLRVSTVEARLASTIRKDPKGHGVTKPTEGAITAAVHLHYKYIDAQEKLIEAKKTAGILEAAVDAMEQRKRMIEVLITLHGQQYFAGPSVPRNLVAAFSERKKRNESKSITRQREQIGKPARTKRG